MGRELGGAVKVLDLFSGIGGMSWGLERTGAFETVAFCEIDPFARAVLAKHWPGVPCFPDIRNLAPIDLSLRGIGPVDVICGGFPCQDLSVAGKGAGLAGARSGLWGEYFRLIRELRPQWVIVENVAALLARGLGTVLGDLATIRYDAEWHCIPAAYVGAPHRRDRIWIVAYPHRDDVWDESWGRVGPYWARPAVAHVDGGAWDLADSHTSGLSFERIPEHFLEQGAGWRESHGRGARRWRDRSPWTGWWESEPDVGRVAYGIPARVDRLRTLGNAVVPPVVFLLGRAIVAAEVRERALGRSK